MLRKVLFLFIFLLVAVPNGDAQMATKDNVSDFKRFINGLSKKDMKSLDIALHEFKNHLNSNKNENDQFFRAYYDFFNATVSELSDGYISGEFQLSPQELKAKGIRLNYSEAGEFLSERPGFMITNFSSFLSNGLKRYLLIVNLEMKQLGSDAGTYLIEDAGLSITWNQLADRIITWENYIAAFPKYAEAKEARSKIGLYLMIYTASSLDNTPLYVYHEQKYILADEVKSSYQRFMLKYKKSIYRPLIKGYYDILVSNRFILNEKAVGYLQKNKINTKQLEWLFK